VLGARTVSSRNILQDWTRVEDLEVGEREFRSYEYHVVEDTETARVTLTIKCFNAQAQTVRLDPCDVDRASDPDTYSDLAERRVRQLYDNGKI